MAGDLVISMGRKYFTREGLEVRIYAIDVEGFYKIHGAIKKKDGDWHPDRWYGNGDHLDSKRNLFDADPAQKYHELKWYPISTAPKDETRIIVNDTRRKGKTYKTKVLVVFWNRNINEWTSTMSNACYFSPTHWMPLPEPPELEEKKNEQ